MKGVLAAHSGMRYIVLLLLIIAVIIAIVNLNKDHFKKNHQFVYLISLIGVHTQFLLGLTLFYWNFSISSGKVKFSSSIFNEGNNIYRYFTIDHPFGMVVAIILITLGYVKMKKATSLKKKHQIIFGYYGISLLIILATIPWPIYGVGANWI